MEENQHQPPSMSENSESLISKLNEPLGGEHKKGKISKSLIALIVVLIVALGVAVVFDVIFYMNVQSLQKMSEASVNALDTSSVRIDDCQVRLSTLQEEYNTLQTTNVDLVNLINANAMTNGTATGTSTPAAMTDTVMPVVTLPEMI